MPLVSVIIPTWNGRDLLRTSLASLTTQTFPDFETIVVDNGSDDGTSDFLRSDYPDVRYVRFEENRGFAAAVNAGIRASSGSIIVLMNNDTEAYPDWLEALADAFREHPEAGSCASRMVSYADRSIIDSAGDKLGLLADQVGHGERDAPWFDAPRPVLTACAGAAAYRRELFDAIGLFDEGFGTYLEDVDVGLRAQLAGFTSRYVPTARIAHMGSVTANRIGGRKLYLLMRNSLFLFFQYMPWPVVLRWGPLMVVWPFAYVLRTRNPIALAFRAVFDFLRALPAVVRRRRWVRRNRRITAAELRAMLSPPVGPVLHPRERARSPGHPADDAAGRTMP